MSHQSYDNQSHNDSRHNRYSGRSANFPQDSSSSSLWSHYSDPRSSLFHYHGSRALSGHHSSSSGQSSTGVSNADKPFAFVKPPDKSFTIVKPNEKSFTFVEPDESRQFTIVTNQEDHSNGFGGSSKTPTKRCDIYSQLSLKQSNYFIFGSQTSSDILKMSFLYAIARMIYEGETEETMIPAIAAAEFAADYLPSNRRLFGSEADAYFVRVMAKAVRDPNFILKVHLTEDLYATLEDFGLPRIYPTLKPEPLVGEQYMRILQILSTSLYSAYVDCDLVIALTAVAPCLQPSDVTPVFLRRLQKIVSKELRKDITLQVESTDIFFEQYLKEASEQEVEEMLVYWRHTIPSTAERLKSLLKRIPGNGLLSIVLIGRALTLCPDFPWDKTLELYYKDWKALNEAMLLVNSDPYYGYRRDKNEIVHSRNYQNLVWLGRQLCVTKLKDDHLNVNVWVEEPTHAAEIKKLVELYLADPQQESTKMDET